MQYHLCIIVITYLYIAKGIGTLLESSLNPIKKFWHDISKKEKKTWPKFYPYMPITLLEYGVNGTVHTAQ